MNRGLILLAVGRVMQMVILFVTFRVMTKLLSVEDVGLFFLLMSIVSYFGLVLVGPVGNYLSRKIHEWHAKKNVLNALFLYNLFLLCVSFIIFPAIFFVSKFIGFQGFPWWTIAISVSFFVFSNSWNNSLIPTLNLLGYREAFVVLTLLTQIFVLLFSYLFVSFYESSALYWLFGQSVAFFIWFLVSLIFYVKKSKESIQVDKVLRSLNKYQIKQLLKFSSPFIVTNISLWLLNQSYRPLVEKYAGLEVLGYIGLGLGLSASLSTAFEYLMQQFYLPTFYKEISSDKKERREKAWFCLASKIIPLYLLVATFVAGGGKYLVVVLADDKFKDAWIYLTIGAGVEFFRMVNNVISLAAQSELNTSRTIYPYIVGAFVSLSFVLLILNLELPIFLIPFAILFGNILVTIRLKHSISKIFNLNIATRPIFMAILSATIFMLMPFIPVSQNLINSLIILSIFGVMLLGLLYIFFERGEKNYE